MPQWPISSVVEWGIDLDQFDPFDWHYDPYKDVILVRVNSKLHTWLCLFGKML
jgi:hypothetical protein